MIVINPRPLDRLCSNKKRTHVLLRKYMPTSIVVAQAKKYRSIKFP